MAVLFGYYCPTCGYHHYAPDNESGLYRLMNCNIQLIVDKNEQRLIHLRLPPYDEDDLRLKRMVQEFLDFGYYEGQPVEDVQMTMPTGTGVRRYRVWCYSPKNWGCPVCHSKMLRYPFEIPVMSPVYAD